MGWLDNLKKGMQKTAAVFKLTQVDFDSLEELEESEELDEFEEFFLDDEF